MQYNSLVASTGSEGFILFWNLKLNVRAASRFDQRNRDLTTETLFYNSVPLPVNIVGGFRREYDEAQKSIRKTFDSVIAEDERRTAQIDKTVSKAKVALQRLYQGDNIPNDEIISLLEDVVELGSRQVLKIQDH